MPVVVVWPLTALSLLLVWLALFLFLRANESRIVFMTDRTHSSSVPIDGTAFHRVQFPTSHSHSTLRDWNEAAGAVLRVRHCVSHDLRRRPCRHSGVPRKSLILKGTRF